MLRYVRMQLLFDMYLHNISLTCQYDFLS